MYPPSLSLPIYLFPASPSLPLSPALNFYLFSIPLPSVSCLSECVEGWCFSKLKKVKA